MEVGVRFSEVEISGFHHITREIKKKVSDNLEKKFESDFKPHLIKTMLRVLVRRDLVASGKLKKDVLLPDNVKVESFPTDKGCEIYLTMYLPTSKDSIKDYADVVNWGRYPKNKMPNIKRVGKWIEVRGITPNENISKIKRGKRGGITTTMQAFYYAMSKSIADKGIGSSSRRHKGVKEPVKERLTLFNQVRKLNRQYIIRRLKNFKGWL